MKKQIIVLMIVISANSFAAEYLDTFSKMGPTVKASFCTAAPQIASSAASEASKQIMLQAAEQQIAQEAASQFAHGIASRAPEICKTAVASASTSAASSPAYLDRLAKTSLGDIATGLSSSVQNIGGYALTASESMAPEVQYRAEQLANAWSSLPRETQQVILGGAVLATAAYNTPTLYYYLMGTVENKRNSILTLAKSDESITEYPLSKIQTNFFPVPGQLGNLYASILNSLYKLGLVNSPRGDLLFFKYLKAFTEDEIYEAKESIRDQLAANALPASSYLQRWLTGRSEKPYQKLSGLLSFNKDLTDIIAQLEKEIEAELNIY